MRPIHNYVAICKLGNVCRTALRVGPIILSVVAYGRSASKKWRSFNAVRSSILVASRREPLVRETWANHHLKLRPRSSKRGVKFVQLLLQPGLSESPIRMKIGRVVSIDVINECSVHQKFSINAFVIFCQGLLF